MSLSRAFEVSAVAGYNGDTYPLSGPVLYDRKHNPFMLMTDIVRSSARRRHIMPATQLNTDLSTGRVPDFVYLTPNLCHDMHGVDAPGSPYPSGDNNALIRIGDRYLAGIVPRILHSRAWTSNSLLIFVWDEGASSHGCCGQASNNGGGRVPAIIIARQGARHHTSTIPYNHYSVLGRRSRVPLPGD